MIEISVVVTNPSGLLIGLLSLGIRQGATILLRADGPQEQEAVQELAGLIASGLGEI